MANDQLQMRLHSPGPVTRVVDSRSAGFQPVSNLRYDLVHGPAPSPRPQLNADAKLNFRSQGRLTPLGGVAFQS